jgi:hypothetical protein
MELKDDEAQINLIIYRLNPIQFKILYMVNKKNHNPNQVITNIHLQIKIILE